MNACHEPISWLRLEHYHLGELPQAERSLIRAHLRDCPHCRAMLAEIEDDGRTLPPLPLPERAPAQPWYRRLTVLLPAVAGPVLAAAAALLFLAPPGAPALPGPRVAVKGGELALDMVRERAGAIQRSPTAFVDGDRFEVLVSTPPGLHPFDLVVLQEGQAFFPIAAGTTAGGNGVAIGAFGLTGPGDATVCVMVDDGRVDRGALEARGAEVLADSAACVTLQHSPGGRP